MIAWARDVRAASVAAAIALGATVAFGQDGTGLASQGKRLFTEQGWKPGTVAIYDSVNLFEACCRDYGKMEGRNRKFSLPRTLMLFAVLVHRVSNSSDFRRRIRTILGLHTP